MQQGILTKKGTELQKYKEQKKNCIKKIVGGGGVFKVIERMM